MTVPWPRTSPLRALHGIPGFGKGALEISIRRGREHRRTGARVHTSTDLDRCRTVDHRRHPDDRRRSDHSSTSARKSSPSACCKPSSGAVATDQADWSSLIEHAGAPRPTGPPGDPPTAACDPRQRRTRSEITDSDFELLVLALLAESGLPTPVLHHRVHDGERFVAEVDLAYPVCGSPSSSTAPSPRAGGPRAATFASQNDLDPRAAGPSSASPGTGSRLRPDLVVAEIRAAPRGRRRGVTPVSLWSCLTTESCARTTGCGSGRDPVEPVVVVQRIVCDDHKLRRCGAGRRQVVEGLGRGRLAGRRRARGLRTCGRGRR